jgi:hypothetical protein
VSDFFHINIFFLHVALDYVERRLCEINFSSLRESEKNLHTVCEQMLAAAAAADDKEGKFVLRHRRQVISRLRISGGNKMR